MKEPSPEARDNVTPKNVESRAQLLPEEQARALRILERVRTNIATGAAARRAS